MRILVLLAIGLLLYIIINNLIRRSKRPYLEADTAEKTVRCEHCGVHVLESEAMQYHNQLFCSTEHLEAHRQSR